MLQVSFGFTTGMKSHSSCLKNFLNVGNECHELQVSRRENIKINEDKTSIWAFAYFYA